MTEEYVNVNGTLYKAVTDHREMSPRDLTREQVEGLPEGEYEIIGVTSYLIGDKDFYEYTIRLKGGKLRMPKEKDND